MAVSLSKGQRVLLDSSMRLALIGLGWDTNQYAGDADFDLDASAFLLGASGLVSNESDFVFYHNLKARNGAVVHTGDNRTGDGDGDDETIMIDFSKLSDDIQKIAITVTIHEAEKRKQSFGQVSNAYVRVAKMRDEFDSEGEAVLRFDLEEEFSTETALVVCEIYRRGGEWKFNAVAGSVQGGLEALCHKYGVITD